MEGDTHDVTSSVQAIWMPKCKAAEHNVKTPDAIMEKRGNI